MFRAVKTGLLVTFITASGIAVAQDEAPPPTQFSTQDEAGPQGAAPQDRGPQMADQKVADQNSGQPDNQGWRRLGPAPYPQNGGDPRYGQPGPSMAIGAMLNLRHNRLRIYRRNLRLRREPS